jgi:hypothetical protein
MGFTWHAQKRKWRDNDRQIEELLAKEIDQMRYLSYLTVVDGA